MKRIINRFVTPHAIKYKAREKLIMERTKAGHRGPIGAIRLTADNTVDAFLDYFDMLGDDGWIYSGVCEDPDLPYGGVHVFYKWVDDEGFKSSIVESEIIDEQPLSAAEVYERERERQEILAQTKDPRHITSESLNNEMMRRENPTEDPDEVSDIIEDIAYAVDNEQITEDVDPQKVRFELYKQYEEISPNKKAIWRGKETEGFKEWLEEQQNKWAKK